jgi:hypothetical protein
VFVLEEELDELDAVLDRWAEHAERYLGPRGSSAH